MNNFLVELQQLRKTLSRWVMMDLTPSQSLNLAGNFFKFMTESYQKRQARRVDSFMRYVDLRLDTVTPEHLYKLNTYIHSEDGQEVLATFADSITQTSSNRVLMALAMLYCQDPDYLFNDNERITFVSAMMGMTDDLLDFFLVATSLERNMNVTPYPIAGINIDNSHLFTQKGWDEEAIFVYVNDLIRLRLILPDPITRSSTYGGGNTWSLCFGITDRSIKMARLIRKATELLKLNKSA